MADKIYLEVFSESSGEEEHQRIVVVRHTKLEVDQEGNGYIRFDSTRLARAFAGAILTCSDKIDHLVRKRNLQVKLNAAAWKTLLSNKK